MILTDIFSNIKSKGIRGILSSIKCRIFPERKTAICFNLCKKLLSNRVGLEIGGTSDVFRKTGILPVYPIIKQLDNCNFAGITTWEGSIMEGLNFYFDENNLPGNQYLLEATNLSKIDSAKYDFILSSHMLEHSANPLKALSEWTRVLKDNGFMILLVPHKDATFDHQRPVTTLEHIIKDFETEIQENDLTHLSEILRLHDLSRDPAAGTFESFKERSEKNFENRCLHHHIFDTSLVVKILNRHNLQIYCVEPILPLHIIIIVQKVDSNKIVNNDIFMKRNAKYKYSIPFVSDRN